MGLAGLLSSNAARAQSTLFSGCLAVAGGELDQSVWSGGIGATIVLVESFAAGQTITVTITNASNSLFDISGTTTLFSGETGTLTRSYVFLLAATVMLLADIQAKVSSGATISSTCSGKGSPPTPTPTPATPSDTDTAVNSGMDPVDQGRPGIGLNDLPSCQQKNNRLVKIRGRIARTEAYLEENDHERASQLQLIEEAYPNELGIDPESPILERTVAGYFFRIKQLGPRLSFDAANAEREKVGVVLRQLANKAVSSGRSTKN